MFQSFKDNQQVRKYIFSDPLNSPTGEYFVNVYSAGYGSRISFYREFAKWNADECEERPIYLIRVRRK